MKAARAVVFVLASLILAAAILVPAVRAERVAPARQEARSMAQQKIDARLMLEVRRRRGDAAMRGVARGSGAVQVDRHGRAYIDVHAPVTAPLQKKITATGGRVISASANYQTIAVWMPLLTIERLANDGSVRSISPGA